MAGGAVISPSRSHPGRQKPSAVPRTTPYVWQLTILSCVGGLLFGYDTGIVSGAMLYIPENWGMAPVSPLWHEMIVSITPGVAALGALLAGKSSDIFGRRAVVIVASLIFVLGALVCAGAPEKVTLLIGRILLGAAIGFASMMIPVYISEASPCNLRGFLVTIYQIMIASGFIAANAIAAVFAHIDPVRIGWRLMFGFAAVPAAIQLIGFYFLSDTPRFLYQQGRIEECERVLGKIYDNDAEWTQFDLDEIRDSLEEEKKAKMGYENTSVISRVLQTPHVRRALLLGCSMQMFQQIIGINTIMYYSGTIVQSAGIEDKIDAIWIACGVAAAQPVSTLAPLYMIERFGRRVILMSSIIAVILSLCFLGGAFMVVNKDSVAITPANIPNGSLYENFDFCNGFSNCDSCVTSHLCGFCHPPGDEMQGNCLPVGGDPEDHISSVGKCADKATGYGLMPNFCRSSYSWLPIIGMVLFQLAFAFGMAPMPWVFNAEIYPLWARSTCVSLSTASNWVFNLIISLSFLSLGEAISKAGTYFLYAAFGLVAAIVFYFLVPETKGVEIEEVENLFKTAKERRLAHQQTLYLTEPGSKQVYLDSAETQEPAAAKYDAY